MERKWIKGFEGVYEVTSKGTIIRHYKYHSKESYGSRNNDGYYRVSLSKGKIQEVHLMHRLVATYFIPNQENKLVVDHIDEDKGNNSVDNLRWCTGLENAQYYNTKDGRAHHIKLAKERKDKLKEYERNLVNVRAELNDRERLLQRKDLEISKLVAELEKSNKLLEEKTKAFEEYIEKEVDRLSKVKYNGYIDTTGVKFKSIDELVGITGKPITVNGVEYRSCGEAAAYIVSSELKRGTTRNTATISKELRRYLQGKRPSWWMYDRYNIV